jgi:sulfoxide reductase heme-binding subunit YedZ
MNRLIRVVVFIAALIPFAEMIYIAVTKQLGADSSGFILRYSASWALNFLIFSLAIAPAIRITGFNILASLQSMLGLFVLLYASLHVVTWVIVDLNGHWQLIIERVMQSTYLIPGAVAFLLLIPLLANSSRLIQELLDPIGGIIDKLIVPVIILSMIHFFLVTTENRTMPGIYAGVFLTLMGYRGKTGSIPRSVPALIARLLKK